MSESRVDPLRVAVIGTGFGARVQIPALLGMARVKVVALCGTSDQKTKEIANQHGIKAVYTDYEQMLVDIQPDIVSVVTPPKYHNAMTVAAFQVGAHVLCEKPLTTTIEEAEEMLEMAKHFECIHVVDHEFRYLPAWYYQRVLVDQNYVGELMLLEATHMSALKWNPQEPWNWWMDAEQRGGMLWAMGSHYIDAFRWITGREVLAVTASTSIAAPYRMRPLPDGSGEREVTSDDSAVMVLEMEGGIRGVINLSAVAGGEIQRLAVHGSEGALVVQNNQYLWGRRLGQPIEPIDVPSEYEPSLWIPDENLLLGPFAKLAGLMVDQIYGEATIPLPTFEEGLAVQRVLDAASRSAQEGQRVIVAS